jgi:hypothetical protein
MGREVRRTAAPGAAINFYFERGKVRFEVNLVAAQAAQLRISSRLLQLARIVARPD